MYRRVTFQDKVKVPPQLLGGDVEESVRDSLQDHFEDSLTPELGAVLTITGVDDIGDGEIRPEDAGAYYPVTAEAVTYRPELHEVVIGEVAEITEFGAFVRIGPVEALCHVSQIMDDYVSYNAEQNVLSGENGDKILQEGDVVKARITAVSLADEHNKKINLTMRQPGLGKLEWIQEDAEDADTEDDE